MNLYPYQEEVVDWFIKRGSGLNACGVGLGKTIMTLAILKKIDSRSNLIVCPKILIYQWEQEIKRFTPHIVPFVVEGNKQKRKEIYEKFRIYLDKKILIIGYEAMRVDNDILQTL
ncbi:MAG: SNF2-related protein [Nanoarchaeota archaeon]